MGFEYKLELKHPDQSKAQRVVTDLPGVSQATPSESRLEYRIPGQPSSMPEAVVLTTEYGLYFCANSTEGKRFLGIVVSSLAAEFEVVAVSELE
jgi:hypothetical protein